jgi:PAS domain S-box-containing protein
MKSFHLSIQPVTEGLFILSTDITESKRAEEELRRLEGRFRRLLESAPDAMVISDGEGIIQLANAKAEKVFGYTKEEMLGQRAAMLIPSNLQERHQANRALFKEDPHSKLLAEPIELTGRRKDGTEFPADVALAPLETEGRLLVFASVRDITERKKVAQELATQREQLEQQNKELEHFAFIASHDLQEPLRMVTSYVQLLQRRYGEKLDSDANEFIGFAVDGALRMKQLIDDLLTYSRLGQVVTLETVDMNTVMQHVGANLATAITECGALLICDDLPQLRASQTEMLQLMQNLVANAVKFRRNGVIPEIHVSGHEAADHWRFDVRDNGIGIEARYSERVFLPFKRLHDKTRYSGSGIGLAIAQKIVQRYGGRIWFTSVPDQGTTFHFTIKRRSP